MHSSAELIKSSGDDHVRSFFVARPHDVEWFEAIPGERLAILVDSSQSGGAFALMDAVASPGAATPLHKHREDEMLVIVEGVITCRVGEKIFEAAQGTTVVIPAGCPHSTSNRSEAPVRYLTVFSPGGVEGFFRDIADKELTDIPAIGARYGTEILGPPLA